MVQISPASPADLPAILGIYNDVIATTTAVYSETPVTLTERADWFASKAKRDFPILVAREAHDIVAFGTFGEFRAWPCYRHTVEHSVHVRADRRGQGVGRRLIEALLEQAQRRNLHVMVAGIDAGNDASLALHRSLGFEDAGTLREVGRKFGRWLDLKFLQKRLDLKFGDQ